MNKETIKILIVDDHRAFSEGLLEYLTDHPGMSVCGVVGAVSEFSSAIETYSPDVVLMDIALPESPDGEVQYGPLHQHGLKEGLKLKKKHPEIGVLFITGMPLKETRSILLESKHPGGWGYVEKSADLYELTHALLQVARGHRYIGNRTLESMLKRSTPSLADRVRSIFSARETEVLTLIARGLSRGEIAKRMRITEGRVDRILEQVRQKLRDYGVLIGNTEGNEIFIYDYVHLTHLALSMGLVSLLEVAIKERPERLLPEGEEERS